MVSPTPFHPGRPDVVGPVRVDPTGVLGPTRGQARGPYWRSSTYGYYVPQSVGDTPEQRIVEAAAVLPPGGAVTGWGALHWLGARWFDGMRAGGQEPIPLWSPTFVREQSGLTVSQTLIGNDELLRIDGLQITAPVRSVAHEVRYAPSRVAAVVALDMAAYSDLVSHAELAALIAEWPGGQGRPRLRAAAGEADENAWSPAETQMRLSWTDAGFARPLCNQPVFDLEGRHLGTPDLIDPIAGVFGEYDSALHLTMTSRAHDLDRQSTFERHGLEGVVMLGPDLFDPTRFWRRLRDAYDRAAAQRRACGWTLTPPDWWTGTVTVDQRRALSEAERARLLRHRRAA